MKRTAFLAALMLIFRSKHQHPAYGRRMRQHMKKKQQNSEKSVIANVDTISRLRIQLLDRTDRKYAILFINTIIEVHPNITMSKT